VKAKSFRDELAFTLDRLRDESKPVRTTNLASLSDLSRSQAGQFRAAWATFSPARRLELISLMVEQAEANVRLNFHAILRECLNDPDPRVRKLAVDGLWEDERSSLVGLLVPLLASDPASEVRAAAAIVLGQFVLLGVLGETAPGPAAEAEQALRTAWFDPGEVTEVRRRALEGLACTDAADVIEFIDTAYYDESELMRQSAVFAMGRTADPRWGRFVLAELTSHNPAMRFEAAHSAGELALTAAVKPLIRLLDDVDGNVREAAALSLGQIGGLEARRALEHAVLGDDERLAEAATDALQELAFNSGVRVDLLLEYPDQGTGGRAGLDGEIELENDYDGLYDAEDEYGGCDDEDAWDFDEGDDLDIYDDEEDDPDSYDEGDFDADGEDMNDREIEW
jgi:HEAT repeat protein